MVEYPELRGKTVDAEALMVYVFENHRHSPSDDYIPVINSLPLDRWIRDTARPSFDMLSDGFESAVASLARFRWLKSFNDHWARQGFADIKFSEEAWNKNTDQEKQRFIGSAREELTKIRKAIENVK